MSTNVQPDQGRSWFRLSQYDEGRDSPKDVRNILLVVVTLIAAMTFQAGVSPPGGVWQDDKDNRKPGQAIYAAQKEAFYVFIIANTLALSSSIVVIVSLTIQFPFRFEVSVATASMIATYASAIFAVTPDESVCFRYILIVAALPFIVRILITVYKKFKSKKTVNMIPN